MRPHCKSMGIFSDGQGQLTRQSMVGSGQISNSSETIIIIIIMTLFKEDNSVGQVQSSLRSSIKIHTFTVYTSEHQ